MTQRFKRTAAACVVSAIALTGSLNAQALEEENVLPEAKSGECYAKVLVPPVYKTESFTAVVSEATEKFKIIPARFEKATDKVMIKAASTKLKAIAPEYKTVEKRILVSPASTSWVRKDLKSTVAASPGALADLEATGVDIAKVPAGQCFYEHFRPAVYETVEEKVMISSATEKLTVEAAKYNTSEEKVLVKHASKRLVEVPAVYASIEEKVLVESAKSVWKKGTGPIQRIDNTTGEIMCRVDIPAVYETFPKKIVTAPPLTTTVDVPAEFTTVKVKKLDFDSKEVRTPVQAKYQIVEKRQKVSDGKFSWVAGAKGKTSLVGAHTGTVVCHKETPAVYKKVKQQLVKTPGSFVKTIVPAEYKTVSVSRLASDAIATKIAIPEQKKSFMKRLKVSDARLEWRPVLCETNMGDGSITKIQQALARKGYSPGSIDGVIGRGTLEALEKFQKENNLAQGGLTYTTLEALGIEM